MKVKTLKKVDYSKSLIFPVDGTVEIDSEGVLEVSEDLGKKLLKTGDYELVEGEEQEPSLDEKLKVLKTDELKKLAEESELPEDEWKSLKKNELIEYLVSKLS